MKKFFTIISLFLAFDSLSFAHQPGVSHHTTDTAVTNNHRVLKKWVETYHIYGQTVTTEEEFKNLPHFPKQLLNNKVRIVKHDSVRTMDFSYNRITVLLDKHGKIALVAFV